MNILLRLKLMNMVTDILVLIYVLTIHIYIYAVSCNNSKPN